MQKTVSFSGTVCLVFAAFFAFLPATASAQIQAKREYGSEFTIANLDGLHNFPPIGNGADGGNGGSGGNGGNGIGNITVANIYDGGLLVNGIGGIDGNNGSRGKNGAFPPPGIVPEASGDGGIGGIGGSKGIGGTGTGNITTAKIYDGGTLHNGYNGGTGWIGTLEFYGGTVENRGTIGTLDIVGKLTNDNWKNWGTVQNLWLSADPGVINTVSIGNPASISLLRTNWRARGPKSDTVLCPYHLMIWARLSR